MCQAFAENGNKVVLYAVQGGFRVNEFEFYGIEKLFDIKKLNKFNFRGLGAFLYSINVKKLLLQEDFPDLLYGRDLNSFFLVRDAGIPMVLEVHHIPKNKFQYWQIKKILLSRSFKRLITISKKLKIHYARLYPFLNKDIIKVAYNGSGMPKPNTADDSQLKEKFCNRPNVGYVGHLYPGKGMEIIIELAKQIPSIDFHIIGGTDEDLKYWKSKCKFKNIIYHGFVPNGMLNKYYENIDIVLLPYQNTVKFSTEKGNGESGDNMLSLKIFEYMAYSKAIIASNLESLKEVLVHEENCLLCDPMDVLQWNNSVMKLIHNSQLRKQLGQRAFDHFKSKYVWTKRAEIVLDDINI